MPVVDLFELLLDDVSDEQDPLPPRMESTKVVMAGTNTIVIPLMTPGRVSGKITFVKVWNLFAPRSSAA